MCFSKTFVFAVMNYNFRTWKLVSFMYELTFKAFTLDLLQLQILTVSSTPHNLCLLVDVTCNVSDKLAKNFTRVRRETMNRRFNKLCNKEMQITLL